MPTKIIFCAIIYFIFNFYRFHKIVGLTYPLSINNSNWMHWRRQLFYPYKKVFFYPDKKVFFFILTKKRFFILTKKHFCILTKSFFYHEPRKRDILYSKSRVSCSSVFIGFSTMQRSLVLSTALRYFRPLVFSFFIKSQVASKFNNWSGICKDYCSAVREFAVKKKNE